MITSHLLNIFVLLICSPNAKSYSSNCARIMTPTNGQNGNTNQNLNNIGSAMFPPESNDNAMSTSQGVASGNNAGNVAPSPPSVAGQTTPNPSNPMPGGGQMRPTNPNPSNPIPGSGQTRPTNPNPSNQMPGGGQMRPTNPNPSYPIPGGGQMGPTNPNPSNSIPGGGQMGPTNPNPSNSIPGGGQMRPTNSNPSNPIPGSGQMRPTNSNPIPGGGQMRPTNTNHSNPIPGGGQMGPTNPNPSNPIPGGGQMGPTNPNPSNPMPGGAQMGYMPTGGQMGQSPPIGVGQITGNPSNQMPGGTQIGQMPGGGQTRPSSPTGIGQTTPNTSIPMPGGAQMGPMPIGGSGMIPNSGPSGVSTGNMPSISPGMVPTNFPNSGGVSNIVFPTNPSVMTPIMGGGGNVPIQPFTQGQVNAITSSPGQNGNFGAAAQYPLGNLGQPPRQIQNKMVFETKCEEYYSMGSRKVRKAKVQVFIVGGTNSSPKEFPHMAALGYGKEAKKEWLCGGSLISENYVITAAHCLSSKTLGEIQFVRLGATDLRTETLDSEDYNVIKRIAHPGYNAAEQYNDIALLQLETPVKFSDSIAPICLYPSTNNISQQKLIATGWGKTEATGNVSPELQKVELEYFPNSECQKSYAMISKKELPRGIIDETQICAGSRNEEKDTCQGDSGGPLQIQDNGKFYLVGITSFGIGCGKPGSPGVYTRVAPYIPWIENIVWGDQN